MERHAAIRCQLGPHVQLRSDAAQGQMRSKGPILGSQPHRLGRLLGHLVQLREPLTSFVEGQPQDGCPGRPGKGAQLAENYLERRTQVGLVQLGEQPLHG